MQNCIKLETLNLNHNSLLTDLSVKNITENCRVLKVLGLSCCTKLTDTSIGWLVDGCQDLLSLDLGGCRNLSKKSVFELIRKCKSMRAINIYGIKKVASGSCGSIDEAVYYENITAGCLQPLPFMLYSNIQWSGCLAVKSLCRFGRPNISNSFL